VRSPLTTASDDAIAAAIVRGWNLQMSALQYVPEGGGAYHWIADVDDGRRFFITCDDLAIKPWLGSDCDSVFGGLLDAYGTAIDLSASGSAFVVAPLANVSGDAAERVDERHSVSVFHHVTGEPGRWGQPLEESTLRELVTVLAELHGSVPVRPVARRPFAVPRRDELAEALAVVDRRWEGGPFSESARALLTEHRDAIDRMLDDLDHLAKAVPATDVLTHGEPHPGNLIRTDAGLVMVDWDTVAVAPRERDLWMLDIGDGTLLEMYEDVTGVALDRDALVAFRLLWAVSDLASFVALLHGEHEATVDARRSLTAMRMILEHEEPWPHGAPR
jgi:spectinomycin phosphotransferase